MDRERVRDVTRCIVLFLNFYLSVNLKILLNCQLKRHTVYSFKATSAGRLFGHTTQLAILVGPNHAEWDQHIADIKFALNTIRCVAYKIYSCILNFCKTTTFPRLSMTDNDILFLS